MKVYIVTGDTTQKYYDYDGYGEYVYLLGVYSTLEPAEKLKKQLEHMNIPSCITEATVDSQCSKFLGGYAE